jgi:cell division protein FtsW
MLRQRGGRPDYALLTVVGILIPIGLPMVYSASLVDAITLHDNHLYYVWRQVGAAIAGIIGMLVLLRIDLQWLRSQSARFMALAIVLLIAPLALPETMTTVNDARSWIRIGGFSFQPSELAKFALILFIADWLSRRGERVSDPLYGLLPFTGIMAVVCGLVLLGRDLGTTIVIAVIGAVMYFVAGASILHIIGAVVIAAGAFWSMIALAPHRMARIQAWYDILAHSNGAGYQPLHALYALASGGWFGVGIGQSRQKFAWLPQAHTDAIFAIIGEELGVIGTISVLVLFGIFAVRGLRIAVRAPDSFSTLVAVGLTAWIVFQALINIAVVTSLIPFTGLTLPFLSYGGTSLMVSLFAVGMLLNISRHAAGAAAEPADDSEARSHAIPYTQRLALWWRNRWARLPGTGRRRRAPYR